MVRCQDCGFLAPRNRQTRELVEVEGDVRHERNSLRNIRTDHVIPGTGNLPTIYEIVPVCFMQIANFAEEMVGVQEAAAAISKERDCQAFTPWRQGSTPKEHREMLDRKWMLQREDTRDSEARRMRQFEFIVALIGGILIVIAAFIERGGQPTIQVITNTPPTVAVNGTPVP